MHPLQTFNGRHPSESWGPAVAAMKRDASLRWHDGQRDPDANRFQLES
jgi:hypothetical protein